MDSTPENERRQDRVAEDGPTGALLVDFDNLNDRQGRADIQVQVAYYLQQALEVFTLETDVYRVTVRLYGGWLARGVTSRRGSEVASALEAAAILPAPHPAGSGILRGTVELATSLVADPSTHWPDTFSTIPGAQRVRLAQRPHPDGCASNTDCPAQHVTRFTKSRLSVCPTDGCHVSAQTAFFERRQKMVDTIMACDAIDYAYEGTELGIVSSDLDLIPAVARAAQATHRKTMLIEPWRRLTEDYVDVLTARGVIIQCLE